MSDRAYVEYVVQRGDTVVRIAEMFETLTSNVVTQTCHYPDPYKLFPGQKLCILKRNSIAQGQHRIVAGETLGVIAQQHHLSLKALQAANPDAHFAKLVPGTFLRLPNSSRHMMGMSCKAIIASTQLRVCRLQCQLIKLLMLLQL